MERLHKLAKYFFNREIQNVVLFLIFLFCQINNCGSKAHCIGECDEGDSKIYSCEVRTFKKKNVRFFSFHPEVKDLCSSRIYIGVTDIETKKVMWEGVELSPIAPIKYGTINRKLFCSKESSCSNCLDTICKEALPLIKGKRYFVYVGHNSPRIKTEPLEFVED
jgi:hypothetical protein